MPEIPLPGNWNLASGGYITQQIDENLTYDYLHSSEDNLWSILYLTGYLTKARDADLPENLPDGISALMIPNAGNPGNFETTILKWFQESALTWNRRNSVSCRMESGCKDHFY